NSTMAEGERREALQELKEGELEFLFLAPEQLGNEKVFERLKAVKPSLFVVDEAHCISEWGHDFRPDYLRLGPAIEALGHPAILALTATAAPPVCEEIVERLGMRNAEIIVQGFDRPNIWLGVETFHDEAEKKRALLERVQEAVKPGIVYAGTRRHAEEIAEALRERGIKAASYHAGMRASERERVQEQFMNDELAVIVATTAFGMGIDKPNVRFVFHYDISESVDAYYQEIGRAGRDGAEAKAILFYNPKDVGLARFLASSGHLKEKEVEEVAEAIEESSGPVEIEQLSEETHLPEARVERVVNHLEEVGVVEPLPGGEVEVVPGEEALSPEEIAEEAVEAQERHRRFEQSRVEMMRGYAELQTACRRAYLLNYFGEPYQGPCGFCDICQAGLDVQEQAENEPFPVNSKVVHKTWGEGTVMRYESDKMVILFDSVGYKTLAVDIVIANQLLKQAG
ncbi:MAG TPA: RecQ family ATP-dependent DNA helicase, partial [Ktedonobacteraceae bacterium]|nr:RecQ family ATP-dependent DNA helicase [Ktedonobacteraceae bacterium]